MITLASDFGSPYPAAMRGVLARGCDARLVDVAHDLPRQDVRAAAFWLRFVLPEFPPAVHLAVVDPGVGTDRDALVVRAGDHALVGPDNGLLLPAARRLAAGSGADADADTGVDARSGADGPPDAAGPVDVYAAEPDDPASATFHGRDVFAPLAAAVHRTGTDPADGLPEMDRLSPAADPVDLRLPAPDLSGDAARGEVLAVDGFGNAITNLPGAVLDGRARVRVNGTPAPVVRTFADVDPGERLVTVGSHGNVECDVNRGRGDEAFDLATGDRVTLRF